MFEVIFLANSTAGRVFDLLLIVAILASVAVVMADSVHSTDAGYREFLRIAEWSFTILFTVEYLARLWCVRDRKIYARSFFGIVDLLSILPAYLELVFTGGSYVLTIRILRILRLFRILKLSRYIGATDALAEAFIASRRKIVVFLYGVLTLVTIFGSIMYVVEGSENGFTSIPKGIYWAIVTLTTVGYGDVTPQTTLGQVISSAVMIMGYGIIAVPTGIYAAELRDVAVRRRTRIVCPECSEPGHEESANFCKKCGASLKVDEIYAPPES